MGAQLLATTAIVIDRTQSGDNFLRLRVIDSEHGILTCMQRISRKAAGKAPRLDLFDEAHVDLESSNQGRTWFIREALLLAKRTALGASYERLRFACRLARILAENPVHEESRTAVYALLRRALDAWEAEGRADAIYFKSLYLLAQDEGYPVREDWRRKLAAVDQPIVGAVLREPAARQRASPPEIARLTGALEEYLRHETGLRLPA